MTSSEDKTRVLSDLEYLEQHIAQAVPEELYENATHIYNLAIRNIGKINHTPEEHLKTRYMIIVNQLLKYLQNPPQEIQTPMPDNKENLKTKKDYGKFEKTKKYIHKERWISYYHQIDEIISANPDSVLEIGIFKGVLRTVLQNVYHCKYEAMDIDESSKPDYVGSVTDLPFAEGTYDVVACFEVLEHLPYEHFEKALSEIFRVAKKRAVISLPNAGAFGKPNKEHIFNGSHYWEINKIGFELEKIIATIKKIGYNYDFELVENYRISEYIYHHFFVLNSKYLSCI